MSLLPEPTSKQKVYKRTQRRRIPQCYAVTYASIKLLRAMRRPCHSPSPLPEVFFLRISHTSGVIVTYRGRHIYENLYAFIR